VLLISHFLQSSKIEQRRASRIAEELNQLRKKAKLYHEETEDMENVSDAGRVKFLQRKMDNLSQSLVWPDK
jgi:hypothetical protein